MIESYPDNKTSTTTTKIDGLCLGGENVFDSLSLSFYSLILIRFDSIIMAPMVVVVVMVIILEWNVCVVAKYKKKQTNK